jgi:hypothetical protein
VTREGSRGGLRFYLAGWARSRVHRCWTRLGGVGGSLGRHCALSLGVRTAVSVAGWLGSYASGFRDDAGEVVRGVVGSVHHGAGQGWRRIGGLMPCRRACSVRLEGARVHGNMLHALRALGGTVASGWHGWGAAYGGSEVAVSRGIIHGRAGELDGEMTGREVVNAGPAHIGIHCRHGIDPGVSEGYRLDLYSVGSREW